MASSLRRAGTIALVAVIALLLVTQAVAAFNPKIAATSDQSGNTTLSYSQAASDDPAAVLKFLVPPIYIASLAARPEGDTLGSVSGIVQVGGSNVSVSGTITQALGTTTATLAGVQVPLSAAASTCTGVAAHGDYWLLNFTAAGQKLQIPLFVDAILLDTPLSQYAGFQLTMCLPAPTAANTIGAKLLSATLHLANVFTAPIGWNVWHLAATPYSSGTATVNAAGTVLAEAQDRSPQAVTLKAHATTRGAVAVTGQVKQGGKGVTSATVKIMAGKKVIATAKTAAGGYFKASARTTARSLTAIATIGARDLPSCSQPILAPLQCVSATVGGFTTTSDATLVTK